MKATKISSEASKPGILTLARTFGRIATVTFGSGATALALLREEVVEKRKWLGPGQYALAFALARVVPGTNVLACCAGLAWLIRGWGAAWAVLLAVSIPASAITVLLTIVYQQWHTDPIGAAVIRGAMSAIVGIIFAAGWLFVRPHLARTQRLRTAVLVMGALLLSGVLSPLTVIAIAALAGYAWAEPER